MNHVAWGAVALLLLTVGFSSGKELGQSQSKNQLANSCAQSGHFTVKGRGFACVRVNK